MVRYQDSNDWVAPCVEESDPEEYVPAVARKKAASLGVLDEETLVWVEPPGLR